MVQLFVALTAQPERLHGTVQALRVLKLSAQLDRRCVRAQVYAEVADPGAICYLEEWSSRDDMADLVCSVRFMRLLALIETAANPPVIEFRFVSETRGLECVAALRTEPASPGPQ